MPRPRAGSPARPPRPEAASAAARRARRGASAVGLADGGAAPRTTFSPQSAAIPGRPRGLPSAHEAAVGRSGRSPRGARTPRRRAGMP